MSSDNAQWQVLTIADVADVIGGGTPSTKIPENFDGEIPWLTPKDLAQHEAREIGQGERNISDLGLASSSARMLPKGAVLLSSRAPIGYVAVAAQPVSTNQGFRSLVMKNGNVPEFFYYLLKANKPVLESRASGSTFREISGTSLKEISFPIPAPDEQRRIAWALGAIDDKLESNRRVARTLEEIAAALFKGRFVDFVADDELVKSEIGPIPKGWEIASISDLSETRYGYTASAAAEPVGPKFLRVMDINKLPWIDWNCVPYCEIAPEKKERFALKVGDIVVARMADPGKAALVEEEVDAVAASYLVRLRTGSLAEAYYLFGFLRSPAYADYCRATMSGSVQKNMNARVITAAKLPVPPPAQMDAHLEAVLPIRRRLLGLLRENATLSAMRDALTPPLVSGQLRVEPDPEPAQTAA
jgi:type I restriction enzyme, S subunit